jgi:hypothetical protein
MTEEQKLKLKEAREKAKTEKESKFVSADDFNSFKISVVGILENISNKLNSEPERKVMMTTSGEAPKKINYDIPDGKVEHDLIPEYQMIFEKYFDMDDGFKATLKGTQFKMEVPLKLSNAQEAHKTFYKSDIRFKVLDGHDIEGSLEKYCKLVAQNLNYKRNIKLKI